MKAADETCAKPVIVTSTGDGGFVPGVSTITITAGPDELISYTLNGDAPSTDIADAVPSPVVIRTIDAKNDYVVKAIALSETKTPSKATTQDIWTLTPSKYADYQAMYVAKDKGILSGPFYVYALEKLQGKSAYWMLLCKPEAPAPESSIVVKLTSKPSGIEVGQTIDYIEIKEYEKMTTPAQGAMKLVTSSALPQKSNAYMGGDILLPQLDPSTSYVDTDDFWTHNWRVPVEINNVVIENNSVIGLSIPQMFANITPEFEEGVAYNLRGFVGNEEKLFDNFRFFVLSYEKAQQTPTDVKSLSEAFAFEEGNPFVTFACDLSIVTFNRDRNHLFAVDADGLCVAIRGDFTESDLMMYDIIRDFTATLSKADGICYADVAGVIERADYGEETAPKNIDVADLAKYPGQHVSFVSAIERVSTVSSRAAALPEIRVGGVPVNLSAISDETAESIGYAVNDYDAGEKFKFRGIVMPDGSGSQEFWPIEILETSGNKPTGIVDAVVDDDIIIVDGRPVLRPDQDIRDLLGRKVDAATVPAGLYIVTTPVRAVKIVIR